jgi:thiamine-monophosphate kinase
MDGESKLVERVARAFRLRTGASHTSALRLGIGDDAAILSSGGKKDWVLSCDAFLEGVHFLTDRHPADSVGFKSLVRAASDLAAMGATPRFFLLTLAIPVRRTGTWLGEFLRGMARAARSMKMTLAGGDTTKSNAVSISITVVGEIAGGRAVTRAGARPGDLIYVSGTLGRAQLGLDLLVHGNVSGKNRRGVSAKDRAIEGLLCPHLYPSTKLELGAWLARHRVASAMMDISDGLSTDLTRLCTASGVGAQIQSAAIPVVVLPAALSKCRGRLKFHPLQMALHGGEDYELLFTVSPRNAKKLHAAPGFKHLTQIGKVTRGKDIVLINSKAGKSRLKPQGWDPFGS